MSERQDGFIVTGPMDVTAWEPTILHAIDRGVEMVADYDESYGEAEVGDCAGSFTIQRAYRVDLRRAAELAASRAIDVLADGTLGLEWADDHELSARLERELTRAFAADVERVLGPWHETMGGELVEVSVDRAARRGADRVRGGAAVTLSRLLAERDALDLAAWHTRNASSIRDELLVERWMPVPLHVLTLAAEHRVRLAYVLVHLLEWWRR